MTHPDNAAPARARYLERLNVPWWMWVLGLGLAGMLAAEVSLGATGMRGWLPFVLMLPLSALGLWWLGKIRVAVTEDELQVDDARLPLDAIAKVIPLDAAGKRLLLGPGADPLAFVIQRPWISGAVQVLLDDPTDPTPYWVISSRQPERLAGLLASEPAAL